MRRDGPAGYWVSDDPELLDLDVVHRWLSLESYWAAGRPADVMELAVRNSLVFGLYAADGRQAGFARMVTDYATFAWLCDVFVAAEHRSQGCGSFLVETAVNHPGVKPVRQILAARPGRTLYRRHGYGELAHPERWMERPGAKAAGVGPDRSAQDRDA